MKRTANGIVICAAVMLPVLAVTLLGERVTRGEAASPPGAAGQIQEPPAPTASRAAARADESRVPVTFTGGYETDPQDRGRPVVLIAAALGVPPEVFRAAFRNVRPAPAGQEPEPGQVRQNKEALLRALGPYGITNERLDTVSNHYRHNRGRGEMWPTSPAAAYATLRKGAVTGFTITSPGSGYSSPPEISIPGVTGVKAKVTLSFSRDFRQNGAVSTITLENGGAPAPGRELRPGRGAKP
jgi:hypothetical protein